MAGITFELVRNDDTDESNIRWVEEMMIIIEALLSANE